MGSISFTKMHGCGNDYVYIYDPLSEIDTGLAVGISDRHFGVGGDGMVLITRSENADAGMRIFNSDGSEAQMCGNAIRCVAKYLYDNNIVRNLNMTIETKAGIKELCLTADNGEVSAVKVNMGVARLSPESIPADLGGESVIDRTVTVDGRDYRITCVSMGNPHAVVFCDNVDGLDLERLGPGFEHSPLFPERINTEFVEVIGKNNIKMRVWERGSGETLACGTGASAAAVASVLNGYCDKDADIRVDLRGGALVIRYTDGAVFMTGGCTKVFEGEYEL